jgi:hypothetical protein
MKQCVYCEERAGLWSKVCKDCRKLLARVEELRGRVGYGEFLDGLAATGVAKEKIIVFLRADPHGTGSVQDQVTAEMTSELMKVMGIGGSQTPEGVKQIRKLLDKEKR